MQEAGSPSVAFRHGGERVLSVPATAVSGVMNTHLHNAQEHRRTGSALMDNLFLVRKLRL